MTLVLILLLLSALMGAATAPTFRVVAMIPVSLSIAVAAAIAARAHGFQLLPGISVILGCLVVAQLAFALVIFFVCGRDFIKANEIDDEID